MIFIGILFITTIALAGTAAFFSVYGLAQLFPAMLIPVLIMGTSLEAGKLVAASFLYRYWDKLVFSMKSYLVFAVGVLMILTSAGIFGLLSVGYQSDSVPLKTIQTKIDILTKEQASLQTRKKEIDIQISNLPSNFVKGRQKLMDSFKEETNQINSRLPEITKELSVLQTQQVTVESHTGPIVFIAKVFNKDVDDATKYMILLIIMVFDPLAVALTIGTNIAIRIQTEEQIKKDNLNNIQPIKDVLIEEPVIEEPVIEEPVIEEPVIEESTIHSNSTTRFTDQYIEDLVNKTIEHRLREKTYSDNVRDIHQKMRTR